MAISKSTSSSSRDYSINVLKLFPISELKRYLCSREFLLSALWEITQHLINAGEVEDEIVDRRWANYGPIDVAGLTDDEIARLDGYAISREEPTAQIDECVDDPQDQRCP